MDTRARASGAAWVLLGVAVAVGGLLWEASAIAQIVREDEVWARGVVARNVRAKGTERTKLIMRSYLLQLEYDDEGGRTHRQSYSVSSVWTLASLGQPVVKYDPADPDRIATSIAMELGRGRWASAIPELLMAPLLGAAVMFYGWQRFHGRVDARGRQVAPAR